MKIWKVNYTVVFESSSGMKTYQQTTHKAGVFVVAGDSLSSVADVIRSNLSKQETLLPLLAGDCMGDVLCKR